MSTPPITAPGLTLEDDPRFYDSGWRTFTPINGWAGTVKARRLGLVVHFACFGLTGSAKTSNVFANLGAYFGTDGVSYVPLFGYASPNGSQQQATVTSAGLVESPATGMLYVAGTWLTRPAIPTTPPGSPA